MYLLRHGRFWALYDADDSLVCVAVYRKGAREIARRLGNPEPTLREAPSSP